jgi:hypothetical protein
LESSDVETRLSEVSTDELLDVVDGIFDDELFIVTEFVRYKALLNLASEKYLEEESNQASAFPRVSLYSIY